MLEQALVTLAAAGGTAVVTAAGTEAWTGLRQAVAGWFGRGEAQRESTELARLDRTASIVLSADLDEGDLSRVRQEAFWQARIESLLESLDASERDVAAGKLGDLLARHARQRGVSAGPGGLAAGGNVEIHAAGQGSIAAGVVQGGVHMGPPTAPDSFQG
ncbi:hypothetical protein [Streptomyces sp. NPDC002104]